jgi:multiple sugar transport system substrate-binding protein
MKFEKLAYVIISTILVTVFILFSYIFSPLEFDNSNSLQVKKIYYVDNISAAHQKVIDSFNEKFKGRIEVTAINLSFDKFSTNERKELLTRYLRSRNDRIDIFAVDQIWVPRFAKWGVPLDKYFSEGEKKDLLSFATETCYYEDTLVSIPLYIDIALMFYRDDIIKELPDYEIVKNKIDNSITWEEFIELRKRFDNNQPFYVFQADDYEGLMCSFIELMSNQNSPIITGDSMYLETNEGKKALQTLVDLVSKYNVSPKEVIQFKENPSYNYFAENNGIFLRGWPGFLSTDNKDLTNKPEIFKNLKRAPLPYLKGTKPGSVFGGWNLMISKFSTKIPEIIKFTQFLLSEEAQKIMFENGGYLPVNRKIYSDSNYIHSHPELKFYYKLLEIGVHRPFLKQYTNVSDILSYYLNLAIKQEISVDDALKLATEKIKSNSIFIK